MIHDLLFSPNATHMAYKLTLSPPVGRTYSLSLLKLCWYEHFCDQVSCFDAYRSFHILQIIANGCHSCLLPFKQQMQYNKMLISFHCTLSIDIGPDISKVFRSRSLYKWTTLKSFLSVYALRSIRSMGEKHQSVLIRYKVSNATINLILVQLILILTFSDVLPRQPTRKALVCPN